MYELTLNMLQLIENYTFRKQLPIATDRFIYDEAFTPDWLIHHLTSQKNGKDDELWRDGGYCYEYIIDELEIIRGSIGHMIHICDSEDIKEYNPSAEYSYYTGIIHRGIEDIPYLYYLSHIEYEYCNRLSLYGRYLQIDIMSDSKYIFIYETVDRIRELFLQENSFKKINSLKDLLTNSDRLKFNPPLKNSKCVKK